MFISFVFCILLQQKVNVTNMKPTMISITTDIDPANASNNYGLVWMKCCLKFSLCQRISSSHRVLCSLSCHLLNSLQINCEGLLLQVMTTFLYSKA